MSGYMYNSNFTESKLHKILMEEQSHKERLLKELRSMPKGNLLIRKNTQGFAFYRKNGSYECGIKKDKELTRRLARKCYIKNELSKCNDSIKALKGGIEHIAACKNGKNRALTQKTYRRMNELIPLYEYALTEEEREWLEGPYETNPYKREHLRYTTKSGIVVRTKSERFIADILTEYGIMYRYEARIRANGKTYYPDFTILTEDGRTVLWEHFGLMDDSNYLENSYDRMENYRKTGYLTHKNLICTYEDDVISEEIIEDIIFRYLM